MATKQMVEIKIYINDKLWFSVGVGLAHDVVERLSNIKADRTIEPDGCLVRVIVNDVIVDEIWESQALEDTIDLFDEIFAGIDKEIDRMEMSPMAERLIGM